MEPCREMSKCEKQKKSHKGMAAAIKVYDNFKVWKTVFEEIWSKVWLNVDQAERMAAKL